MADEKNAPGRGGQSGAARYGKQLINESMIHAAVPGALACKEDERRVCLDSLNIDRKSQPWGRLLAKAAFKDS